MVYHLELAEVFVGARADEVLENFIVIQGSLEQRLLVAGGLCGLHNECGEAAAERLVLFILYGHFQNREHLGITFLCHEIVDGGTAQVVEIRFRIPILTGNLLYFVVIVIDLSVGKSRVIAQNPAVGVVTRKVIVGKLPSL